MSDADYLKYSSGGFFTRLISVDDFNKVQKDLKKGGTSTVKYVKDIAKSAYDDIIHGEETPSIGFLRVGADHTIDWREANMIGPVRNQGTCKSSWAIVAAEMVESALRVRYPVTTGKKAEVSEQHILDCTGPLLNMGCNGGFLMEGLFFIEDNKPAKLSSTPYTGQMQRCKEPFDFYPGDKIEQEGLEVIAIKPSYANYVQALQDGPIGIVITANSELLKSYAGGIINDFQGCQPDQDIDPEEAHYVLIVGHGFDQETSQNYFIIKNSWGEEWGEQGYVLINADTTTNNGMCGIYNFALQAIY